MRELSLFSGAGGGLLGTHLLGWRPVGYVEWDDYCQRVLRARIDDGYLPDAPIFGDIRAFVHDGYAASYTGLVDVVTGGFPCQPFSTAGKRAGADDPRNMWPATIDVIRVVRPRWCLLENVPGLLSSGYFGTVIGDLAASGYDARWRVLSAAELGAPHKRDRLWILCTDTQHSAGSAQQERQHPRSAESTGGCADRLEQGPNVADAEGQPVRAGLCADEQAGQWGRRSGDGSVEVSDADCAGCGEQWRSEPVRTEQSPAERGSWWATEPALGGMAHGLATGLDGFATDGAGNLARVARGVPDRVSRLKALGNGQVPAVVAMAWRLLTGAAL